MEEMHPMEGQLWRAGPARQDRATATGPGATCAPDEGDEGRDDDDDDEGRLGEKDGECLLLVQVALDSISVSFCLSQHPGGRLRPQVF